ncbi:MAG TPA: FecR domain-containing protein [Candidatus Saccharimonadia bacterium]|nr:FecR domain-containing protein [Candidatus Saccharimonadia bacterium]
MDVYGTMTGRSHQHEALLERAGEWHARLRADDTARTDHVAFAAWLDADARHRLAYADVCAAAYALESAGAPAPLEVRAVERGGRAWLGALAGAAFAAVLGLGLWFGAAPWQDLASDFHTASAEQRNVELPDGSRVLLDGDSAIDVAYDESRRTIELKRGAAFFDVVADSARPFVVRTGDASATAVGTRYAVERTASAMHVTVEEGVVEVRSDAAAGSVRLRAGQGIVVASHDSRLPAASADDAALAWTRQRLVFSATPLEIALARLDRHVAGRIVLVGGARADARVTAAIPAGDAIGGLAAIAREHGLTLRRVPALGYLVY